MEDEKNRPAGLQPDPQAAPPHQPHPPKPSQLEHLEGKIDADMRLASANLSEPDKVEYVAHVRGQLAIHFPGF